jgi:2-polyprenyl-3-methyl-5-hydroxy-6-metoxy-1,4-benzoquinol methylase
MTSNLPVIDALIQAGFIDLGRSEIIGEQCRDIDVPVYRDQMSGVVYLDPCFLGQVAKYYECKEAPLTRHPRNDMDWADAKRRAIYLAPYIAGKRWLDFGCGPGYQLRESATLAFAELGIEINKSNREALEQDGFNVSASLNGISQFSPEVVSLFHVFEHLSDPISILKEIRDGCAPGAVLLLEVPHANDALLLNGSEEFRKFTLWSEHLVLHTTQSLRFCVEASGWQVSEVIGVQRYPVWNHMNWISTGKPSGLRASVMDSTAAQLHQAYESYLAARGMTDTLLLVAINGQKDI